MYLPFEKCWSKQWHYCSIAKRKIKIEQMPRWSLDDTIHWIRNLEAPKRSEADVLTLLKDHTAVNLIEIKISMRCILPKI